jgi:hypothetical protein
MPKPDWMSDSERARELDARAKKCINCVHVGKPIGFTNPIKGKGREVMYQCAKFPSQWLSSNTYACESYERRR